MDSNLVRLLYVDDDPGLRRLIEKKLKRIGYIVSTAENGNDGIDKCNSEDYDVILVDQNMPDISGLELIRAIPHILVSTPIIMMTGGGDENLAVEVLKSGASDYIIKDTGGQFLENIHRRISAVIDRQNLVNDKRRIEIELQDNLSLNKAILDSLSANIAILDHEGTIINVNKQWVDFGIENDMHESYDSVGANYLEVCLSASNSPYGSLADKAVSGIADVINGNCDSFKMVYECSSSVDTRWFEMRVTRVTDLMPAKVVVSHEDITTLKVSEIKLKELSETDGLTGIPNRRVFDDALSREFSRAVRNRSDISLLMVDVDFFKAYNDNYGHLKGDDCITEVARVLKDVACRITDVAARYGGEEFVVLLPDTKLEGALHIGEEIMQRLRDEAIPHGYSSVSDYITVSIGAASMKPDIETSDAQLVGMADSALYKAKHEGRNRICISEDSSKG